VAKTTVTRYCSHQCNSRTYKAKERGHKVAESDLQTLTAILSPIELLKAKEYLSIGEACKLIGISRMTLHRHIKKGKLKTGLIGNRVIIRKKDIDSIFT
jgi:excisionase family DNA binding protein